MTKKNVEVVRSSSRQVLQTFGDSDGKQNFGRSLGGIERFFAIAIIVLLAVGVFGAVGSNLNLFTVNPKPNVQSPKSEIQHSATQNSVNPNMSTQNSAVLPTSATPQLSKEYVYAGSRMLAVEDANANAAPPADLAVWRPSTGVWWVLGGVPGSAQIGYGWGMSGDIPAPGDYDGDGKTDFSIVRPSNSGGTGVWWILYSSTNAYTSISFGLICPPPTTTCDKLAQADFDGDGKTDPAVFRSSDGTWYILPSGGGSYYGIQYGLGTDIPAPADYDGDGKADIAVWRNSSTTFYSSNSSNGDTSIVSIGQSGSGSVSGDYDGDGRADYAIRNGNTWIIKNSGNGATDTIAWQTATDIAVQNDYDGDGKVDIAVWNSSNGNWFIRQSGSNNSLRQVQWGTAGDTPVAAYYRR